MLIMMQTLPVYAQISTAIDQGLDLTGDTVSNLAEQAIPIENAGQLTKDGFSILKDIYHVMRSVHHFMTQLITAIATNQMGEEEAARITDIIAFGSIVATIVIGSLLLRGIWRHLFLLGIIIFLVILGASFLDNRMSFGI